jgi:hypothetical protein
MLPINFGISTSSPISSPITNHSRTSILETTSSTSSRMEEIYRNHTPPANTDLPPIRSVAASKPVAETSGNITKNLECSTKQALQNLGAAREDHAIEPTSESTPTLQIDLLNLPDMYLLETGLEIEIQRYSQPSNEGDSYEFGFSFLEKNIDNLRKRHIERTLIEDIDALIEDQEEFLAAFKKTINKNGDKWLEKIEFAENTLDELEDLREQLIEDDSLAQIIQGLRVLRFFNEKGYDRIIQTTVAEGKRTLDFLTQPRLQITTPQEALEKYIFCKKSRPHYGKLQSEFFKKWMEIQVQNATEENIDHIYEHIIKPVASHYEEQTAMEYFSALRVKKVIELYKQYALKQFESDFTRTKKIILGNLHINNTSMSDEMFRQKTQVIFSHPIVKFSFEKFIETVYLNCIHTYVNKIEDFRKIDFRNPHNQYVLQKQFDAVFAKILLFASQSGDAAVTRFCSANDLYLPVSSSMTRELYIQENTLTKISITSSAMPSSHLVKKEKDPIDDGIIQFVQIYDFVTETTSMHFIRFEDKDGNFLG